MTGEQAVALATAILESGIKDALHARYLVDRIVAQVWILDHDWETPFSFLWLSDQLGVTTELVVRIRKLVEVKHEEDKNYVYTKDKRHTEIIKLLYGATPERVAEAINHRKGKGNT